MNMKDVDLNLLLVFEALYRERSVSMAAAKLMIGQPAASNSLSRLRDVFDDELFRREGRVMVPTSRALALAEPILRALEAAREALELSTSFDPQSARRTFNISGGDYALSALVPTLMHQIRSEAPHVDLRFRFLEKDPALVLLEEGKIDLVIGVFPSLSKRFDKMPICEDGFVSVMRRDHPLQTAGISLQGYAEALHVLVTERGDETGAVDAALANVGLSRRVALTVPSVMIVRRVLLQTDLIATIGERMARTFSNSPDLIVSPTPVDIPRWTLSLISARRSSKDPAIQWLSGVIKTLINQERYA